MASADFSQFVVTTHFFEYVYFKYACETSPGTHTFFPSLPAAFTEHNPCSYWALFCQANSPSFTALYAISVRQARVLPIKRPFNS